MIVRPGRHIGNLVVLARSHGAYWHCLCQCGNLTLVRTGNLSRHAVRSCGCLRKAYYKRAKTGYTTSTSLPPLDPKEYKEACPWRKEWVAPPPYDEFMRGISEELIEAYMPS